MAPDPHARPLDDEIAEIENRRGTRNLFMILGGVTALLLALVVVLGARERARLAEESARPRTQGVALGNHVGTVSNTAVFADGQRLNYVEGAGDVEIGLSTEFVRRVEYDAAGRPDSVPASVTHWSLAESDSLPYVLEPVLNPLTGVNPADYRALPLGSLRPEDYGGGGPNDWRTLEQEETNVSVTGRAQRVEGAVYLVDDPVRVRLQAVEGLSPIDSLEVAWATGSNAPLTGYGRITSTPRGAGTALFVLAVTSVHTPTPDQPAPGAGADTAGAETATPADTAAGEPPNP